MREYIISIWNLIDPLYYQFTRLTYLPSKEGNIFRVRLTKYKGRNIVLADGTEINKNDTLVKIHLHNVRLLKEFKTTKSELKKAKTIYRYVQKSLPEINLYIQNHPQSSQIKGIIGITTLNKGCKRLGFEVFSISHPVYQWFKRLAFLPIELISSNNSLWHVLKNHKPSYLIMSIDKLSTMYRMNNRE
ncbi:hypothetical protein CHH83_07350 [Bacillus sp. 7586-K]|nr:hypothetical protein CHH83_07350 [Bacillus sp. 7586-K]